MEANRLGVTSTGCLRAAACLAAMAALSSGPFRLPACAGDASFDDLEPARKLENAAFEASGRVLECPSRIAWDGDDAFVYATRSSSGDVLRRFDVPSSNLVDIAQGPFDAVQKRSGGFHEPPAHHFISPSGGDPIASPDGSCTAFVRDHNVWIRFGSAAEEQLSWDGSPDDPYVNLMWSPDSRKLAAMRLQQIAPRQITLVESRPSTSVHAATRTISYTKPGDACAQATPVLFVPSERRSIPIDLSGYDMQYELLLDCWSPDSAYFTFLYTRRGFQLHRYSAVDATTGRVRTIAEESSPKFVFVNNLRRWWLADGSRLLWISSRDDWRHLYLVNPADGSIEQLTKGEWNVREVLRIDEASGRVFFFANGFAASSGEDPYNKHLLRLDLATRTVTDLTPSDGEHYVNLNPSATRFVDYWDRPDLPPRCVVRDASDGRLIASLPPVDVSCLDTPAYPRAEVFHAKGRDGTTDIWGVIWRPCNFDPSRRYPVVEYIYAGPHDSHVPKDFPVNPPRGIELLADGFVVVQIDGMGTANRSRTFHEVCWRNLKDAGIPDRILWIRAAAESRPWMDLSRVGIYGYSAGGQNAMSALLFHGSFYRSAVALCGCHDNRVDKIWWNEQWMGYPIGPWYAENSNVVNAHLLNGDLLLVNGELDDNVDPVSTLQVVGALVKANKRFEQLYLPGFGHDLSDRYIGGRILDFFRRTLKDRASE